MTISRLAPAFPLWESRLRRLVLAALAGLLFAAPPLAAQGATATPGAPRAAESTRDSARDARLARADRGRIRGRSDAPWIVVVSDYQCPFCKRWHDETAPLIERDYVRTGKVQIAYLNFPISASHPNAQAAHETAMCAAEQDRFWPVSDALFDTQSEWNSLRNPRPYFDSLAVARGVEATRFRQCITGGEMRELIAADLDRAQRIGVGSTPTFLIGGRPLIGAQPYDAFRRAIDAALAAPTGR